MVNELDRYLAESEVSNLDSNEQDSEQNGSSRTTSMHKKFSKKDGQESRFMGTLRRLILESYLKSTSLPEDFLVSKEERSSQHIMDTNQLKNYNLEIWFLPIKGDGEGLSKHIRDTQERLSGLKGKDSLSSQQKNILFIQETLKDIGTTIYEDIGEDYQDSDGQKQENWKRKNIESHREYQERQSKMTIHGIFGGLLEDISQTDTLSIEKIEEPNVVELSCVVGSISLKKPKKELIWLFILRLLRNELLTNFTLQKNLFTCFLNSLEEEQRINKSPVTYLDSNLKNVERYLKGISQVMVTGEKHYGQQQQSVKNWLMESPLSPKKDMEQYQQYPKQRTQKNVLSGEDDAIRMIPIQSLSMKKIGVESLKGILDSKKFVQSRNREVSGYIILQLRKMNHTSQTTVSSTTVRTSATPEEELASLGIVLHFGSISPKLLGFCDLNTSSVRTYQLSVDGDFQPYSVTLPRSGMMRNGTVSQQVQSGHDIGGTESLSSQRKVKVYELPPLIKITNQRNEWPTPNNQERIPQRDNIEIFPTPQASDETRGGEWKPGRQMTVKRYVQMFPTPTTQDCRIGPNNMGGSKHRADRGSVALADVALGLQEMWPTPTTMDTANRDLDKVEFTETGRRKIKSSEEGESRGLGLADKVQMWPTPTTRCYVSADTAKIENGRFVRVSNSTGRKFGASLGSAVTLVKDKVQMWPTPNAIDATKWNNKTAEERKEKGQFVRLGNQVSSKEGVRVGGQLNPDWVCWLMGFPVGWENLNEERLVEYNWSYEPEIPRVSKGTKKRINRIGCLGNAVVPQVAEVFAKAIREDMENGQRQNST